MNKKAMLIMIILIVIFSIPLFDFLLRNSEIDHQNPSYDDLSLMISTNNQTVNSTYHLEIVFNLTNEGNQAISISGSWWWPDYHLKPKIYMKNNTDNIYSSPSTYSWVELKDIKLHPGERVTEKYTLADFYGHIKQNVTNRPLVKLFPGEYHMYVTLINLDPNYHQEIQSNSISFKITY